MRKETITYEIYKFDELSETAKEKALDDHRYVDISEEYWYESIADDAKNLGIDITAFDISRMTITLDFRSTYLDDIANSILKEYGKESRIYIAALEFLTETAQASKQDISEELLEALIEDLEKEFKSELSAYFIKTLDREYDYLTSDEAIIEFFEANEVEFHKDGRTY